jgi:hypothetical protein
MLPLSMGFFLAPHSVVVGLASGIYLASTFYFLAGSARGVGGIALSASILELAPRHFMGRVQTLFSLIAIILQVSLAPVAERVAQRHNLTVALARIAVLYLMPRRLRSGEREHPESNRR